MSNKVGNMKVAGDLHNSSSRVLEVRVAVVGSQIGVG